MYIGSIFDIFHFPNTMSPVLLYSRRGEGPVGFPDPVVLNRSKNAVLHAKVLYKEADKRFAINRPKVSREEGREKKRYRTRNREGEILVTRKWTQWLSSYSSSFPSRGLG